LDFDLEKKLERRRFKEREKKRFKEEEDWSVFLIWFTFKELESHRLEFHVN